MLQTISTPVGLSVRKANWDPGIRNYWISRVEKHRDDFRSNNRIDSTMAFYQNLGRPVRIYRSTVVPFRNRTLYLRRSKRLLALSTLPKHATKFLKSYLPSNIQRDGPRNSSGTGIVQKQLDDAFLSFPGDCVGLYTTTLSKDIIMELLSLIKFRSEDKTYHLCMERDLWKHLWKTLRTGGYALRRTEITNPPGHIEHHYVQCAWSMTRGTKGTKWGALLPNK